MCLALCAIFKYKSLDSPSELDSRCSCKILCCEAVSEDLDVNWEAHRENIDSKFAPRSFSL